MTFHRGQKVACLDASNWNVSGYGDEIYPDQDGVYTVRDVVSRGGVPALLLEEIRNDRLPYSVDGKIEDTEQAFAARRFKPVVAGEHKRELEAV
ncbi:MAG: Uncharacterized protein FD152_3674 [Xanthobacteraceae bacterium]|nr:MAG: Uncharacterized protein FD152_3674 [Xanthobacteraceae bacterium]